jgi:hypothetical protein
MSGAQTVTYTFIGAVPTNPFSETTTTATTTIPYYISTPSSSGPTATTCPGINGTFYNSVQNGTIQTFRRACGINLPDNEGVYHQLDEITTNTLDECADACGALNTATNITCFAVLREGTQWNCNRYSGVALSWVSTDMGLLAEVLVAIEPFG